jgi:hypothetical protein
MLFNGLLCSLYVASRDAVEIPHRAERMALSEFSGYSFVFHRQLLFGFLVSMYIFNYDVRPLVHTLKDMLLTVFIVLF